MNELVSLIVPVYNVEKYLHRCLNSLINQTYKNLEIIVVNDGSTDNSDEICNYYASIDSRIKVIHKKNGGLSDARNYGIEYSNGELIAFVDSDDYVENDFIEILHSDIITYNADIAEINYRLFSDNKYYKPKRKGYFKILRGENILKEYFSGNVIENNVWNKIFKKELISNIRFKVGYTSEDLLFTYEALKNSSSVVVNTTKTKYNYYMREGSIVNQSISNKAFDSIKLTNIIILDVSVTLKEYAYAKIIREKLKVIRRLVTFDRDNLYINEKNQYILDIKSYPFLKSLKYLSLKHVITLQLMKISPKIYEKIYIIFQKQ